MYIITYTHLRIYAVTCDMHVRTCRYLHVCNFISTYVTYVPVLTDPVHVGLQPPQHHVSKLFTVLYTMILYCSCVIIPSTNIDTYFIMWSI